MLQILNSLFGSKPVASEVVVSVDPALQLAGFETTAIRKAMAVIKFDPKGMVLDANENFLVATGYQLSEIKGNHHRQFIFEEESSRPSYRQFWEKLLSGQFVSGQFRRRRKDGHEIWIEASYFPVCDQDGQVVCVIKYAADITDAMQLKVANEDRLAAIDWSQAVIEFDQDGIVETANENFLAATGYHLDEVVGQHHRMFVRSEDHNTAEYKIFWEQLRAGKSSTGKYRRIRKSGEDIWLDASYNAIKKSDGTIRVVKFATDITAQYTMKSQMAETGLNVTRNVEHMVATLDEISSEVHATASLATTTEKQAQNTRQSVQNLDDSSKAIGRVVELIQGLSDQTNLLALNATIEAARAGHAGRGFAVVASEVKELSRQTGEATKGIEKSVLDIQKCVGEAVESSDTINQGVSDFANRMTSVAKAVQEQSVTMGHLREAAGGLRE